MLPLDGGIIGPGRLYHYTTVETLLLYILPQKALRFSAMKETNDPEEVGDYYFGLTEDPFFPQKSHSPEYVMKEQRDFNNAVKNGIKILCFSQDGPTKEINGRTYFQSGYSKPRMWAQYANNHTGVCLVLNKEEFIRRFNDNFDNKFHMEQEVVYEPGFKESSRAYDLDTKEISMKGIEGIVEERRKKFASAYYFSKHPDWKDESEYRFLVKDDSKEYPTIELDGVLTDIILGTKADKLLRLPIDIMVKEFHILPQIYGLRYFQGKYSVDIF